MDFYDGRTIDFPAINKVSFHKLYLELEKIADGTDPHLASYAKDLLVEAKAHPVLDEGIEDFSTLEEHRELIDKLLHVIFPPALTNNEIKVATPPFAFSPFYTSARFKRILDQAGPDYEMTPEGFTEDDLIHSRLHGDHDDTVRTWLKIFSPHGYGDPQCGEWRCAPLPQRLQRRVHGGNSDQKGPKLKEEELIELMDNITDIDLWKRKFPPNSYILRGIGIMNLQDITVDQSIHMLQANLLEQAPDTFQKVSATCARC